MNLMFAKNQIQRSIDDPKNSVPDDIQKLFVSTGCLESRTRCNY